MLELHSSSCTCQWSFMWVGHCSTTAHFRSSTTLKFFLSIFIESEWQLLLSFIMETVSICPQAFVSSVHHSSTVPNRDHGERKYNAVFFFCICNETFELRYRLFQLLSWCIAYCILVKEIPLEEHLTNLTMKGLGALSIVSAFQHERVPCMLIVTQCTYNAHTMGSQIK